MNRREVDRIPLKMFLNEYVQDRPHRAVTTNISPTGLYVNRVFAAGKKHLQFGREDRYVQLEFALPGTSDTIWARGEIRYDELDGGPDGPRHRHRAQGHRARPCRGCSRTTSSTRSARGCSRSSSSSARTATTSPTAGRALDLAGAPPPLRACAPFRNVGMGRGGASVDDHGLDGARRLGGQALAVRSAAGRSLQAAPAQNPDDAPALKRLIELYKSYRTLDALTAEYGKSKDPRRSDRPRASVARARRARAGRAALRRGAGGASGRRARRDRARRRVRQAEARARSAAALRGRAQGRQRRAKATAAPPQAGRSGARAGSRRAGQAGGGRGARLLRSAARARPERRRNPTRAGRGAGFARAPKDAAVEWRKVATRLAEDPARQAEAFRRIGELEEAGGDDAAALKAYGQGLCARAARPLHATRGRRQDHRRAPSQGRAARARRHLGARLARRQPRVLRVGDAGAPVRRAGRRAALAGGVSQGARRRPARHRRAHGG